MAEKTTKKPALDIFSTIRNINKKNPTFFSSLTDNEKKGFFPYMIQRWLHTTTNTLQYILLNEYCNKFINSPLNKHPELIYKLLTVCGVNENIRYTYTAPKTKKSIKTFSIKIISEYYTVSTKVAEQYASVFSTEDVYEMGQYLGYQQTELNQLK